MLILTGGTRIVTGKHYASGQLGVYFLPGAIIPGYLAEDLWIKGRASANCWVEIGTKNMRGIDSPGVFAGETYAKVRAEGDLIRWPYWRDHWQVGDEVAAYLGVR